MPSPSPYLQESWIRWANRGALTRKDVEFVLGGFHTKSRVLEALREKIRQHRQEDRLQLMVAHEESYRQWDERLLRLKEWAASAEGLGQKSGRIFSWLHAAEWFDRAQAISRKFILALERKIEATEKRAVGFRERAQKWKDRLALKDIDLNEMVNRQADVAGGILVSSARKNAYLDFIYQEREEEGRLALELRKISGDVRQALQRLARSEALALQKAALYPAYAEIRKNQIFAPWRLLQSKLDHISEEALVLGLSFEEGRKRLRSIYEWVQKMRIVEDPFTPPRPFLHRLFNLKDE